MANSFGTSTTSKALRDKYRLAQLDQALRNALVAEKVCSVDRTDLKTISNPYITAVSTTIQAVAGTYSPVALTTTDEQLTVADEAIAATHIFDFEKVTANFDLMFEANRAITNSLVQAIDKWVLNNLCEDGTGTLNTPSGGFATPANFLAILAGIQAKVAGYADAINGVYIIVENSDLVGILQSQAGSGFNFQDSALRNGLVNNMLGVDIYVVRDGTFVDATTTAASGSKTWTNLGHRVGGVKNVTTYASPRGIHFEEKGVTGKTGMEVVGVGYIGFRAWTPRATLTIDITIVA